MSDTPLFDKQNEIWERFHKELPQVVRRLQGTPEALKGSTSDLKPRPRPVPTEAPKPSVKPVLLAARKGKRSGNPAKRARAAEIERRAIELRDEYERRRNGL